MKGYLLHSFVLVTLSLTSLACDIPKCKNGDMPVNYKEIGDYCNGSGKNDNPPAPFCPGEPEPTKTTTSSVPTSTGFYAVYSNSCTDVARMDGKPVDPEHAVNAEDDCIPVCSKEVAAAKAAGSIYGSACRLGDESHYIPDGDYKLAIGDCICNPAEFELGKIIVTLFLEALPLIAKIIEKVWIAAFEFVATLPLDLVMPEGAIGVAVGAAVDAANLCKYTYEFENGFKAFFNWAKEIGGIDKDIGKMKEWYQWLIDHPGDWKPPKDITKGGGKDGDKGCPPDWDKTDPSKDPPKNPKNPCKNGKDKDGKPCNDDDNGCKDGKDKDGNDCGDDSCDIGGGKLDARGVVKPCTKKPRLVTKTVIEKSVANTKTIKVDCDVVGYTQACYHYYYAMQEGVGGPFTCSDEHSGYPRSKLLATRLWAAQHNTDWRSYTASYYTFQGAPKKGVRTPKRVSPVACDRDEWPPAYFYDPSQHKSQLVRWIPAEENRGVAQKWTSWCKKNDGGDGNGQLDKDGKVNKRLVKLGKQISTRVFKGTKYEAYEATYTRGVFQMTFKAADWQKAGMKAVPDKSNDFGLAKNPCWPRAIARDDPGFAVNTDDPYYTKYNKRRNTKQYRTPPSRVKKAVAKLWMSRNGGRLPPRDLSDIVDSDGAGKPYLDVSDEGTLTVRDLEANSTRPLTDDEIRDNVRVVDCEDKDCAKERRELLDRDEEALYLEGDDYGDEYEEEDRPTMSPPEHVEAVATDVPEKEKRAATQSQPVASSGSRKGLGPVHPHATPPPAF